jgi:hypothetical protein
MWVALAAMAVVSLARVQTGVENPSAYANPVLAFLAGQPNPATVSTAGGPQIVRIGSARNGSGVYLHDASSGGWTAILPVLFVGLMAPMSLISPRRIFSLGRTPSFPGLPEKFQRPPPAVCQG